MTATVGFRWLDRLEQEFDKSVLELDQVLHDYDDDDGEMIDLARGKIQSVCSSFSQLVHKSLTVFQNNAKLEAHLVYLRDELSGLRASKPAQNGDINSNGDHNIIDNGMKMCEKVRLLEAENAQLRQALLTLQSELTGTQLASKYLDKELAGRIQQLQILTKGNMKADIQQKLWTQLESEIFLQRHKTIIRACQANGEPAGITTQLPEERPAPQPVDERPRPPSGARNVLIKRNSHEGLGLSITGGKEYGLPILISRIHERSPAHKSSCLFVGDSILAANDSDLRDCSHPAAVELLSATRGNLELEVSSPPENIISLYDDSNAHNDTLRYPILHEDVGVMDAPTTIKSAIQVPSPTTNLPPHPNSQHLNSPQNLPNSPQHTDSDSAQSTRAAGEDNPQTVEREHNYEIRDNKELTEDGKVTVQVGAYRMANIQSLDEEVIDQAAFNAN